jgi:putative MATE family efflux protein
MKKIWSDKIFLKSMLAIALPIALQNLIMSSLNMVDTLMISSLGDASIAAVGLANQVFFFYILIVFGINSGSSIFIAQFWGKEDIPNIRRILGLAISLCTAVGLIFTTIAFVTPEFLMRIFTDDVEIIDLGSKYLKIVSLSYIITAISFAYSVASRSIGQAKMPMFVSSISFVTNIIFNWLLIFGKLGFPKLGIAGAAYGTLIARIVEICVIFYFVYSNKGALAAKIKELTDWDKSFLIRYFKTTYPVILNEGFWSLGQVMYSIAYAKIGKEAIAAVQITTTIQNIFMVISRGLANACTVMVGNKIGAEQEDEAADYAKSFLVISTVVGLILGILLFLLSGVLLKAFRNITPEVFEASIKLLKAMAIFFFIRMFNSTTIVGVLRGGGDTKFSMALETVSVWLVGVPFAFIGAILLSLPVHWVFVIISFEDVVKAIISFWRIKSDKWIRNVTSDM